MPANSWLEKITTLAAECVAPVWASRAGNEPAHEVDHNGTITFIDTGQRKIAVTAYHVIKKYREMAKEIPTAALAINLGTGVTPGMINLEVIDEDPELDLVVLDLPDIRSFPGSTKRYFPIASWPIPIPAKGDPVTIAGFPGIDRKPYGNVGTFSLQGIGMVVSNHPGRNVALADEAGTLRTIRDGKSFPQGLTPGGLSGAAGFFFKDDRFHVAGFVYEGTDRILLLVPGARLQPDGLLR